jgi:hypothetical protein
MFNSKNLRQIFNTMSYPLFALIKNLLQLDQSVLFF